jgi:hypothetical protein
MRSARHPEVRPLPLDRLVEWRPLDEGAASLASSPSGGPGDEPVIVVQDAILEVEDHIRRAEAGAFGLLHGAVCVWPVQELRYLLVEGTVPVRLSSWEGAPAEELAAELRALAAAVEEGGRSVVGWYRSGASVISGPSRYDVGLHRALCTQSWQVALLREEVGPCPRGVLMRVDPASGDPCRIPFYELLPPPQEHGARLVGVSVTWSNYRSMEGASLPLPLPSVVGAAAPAVPAVPDAPDAAMTQDAAPDAPMAQDALSNAPAPTGERSSAATPAASEIERLFDPVPAPIAPWTSGGDGGSGRGGGEMRGAAIGAEGGALGDSSSAWRWAQTPRPRGRLGRRRRGRVMLLLVMAGGALAAAWHVYRWRSERAVPPEGGEVTPRQARPSAVRSAADSTALAERLAATRFAEQRIDESSAMLQRSIEAFDAALAGAAEPARKGTACARADSAFVAAMASANAIAIAERQLGGALDPARAARARALAARVDSMPAALRSTCR